MNREPAQCYRCDQLLTPENASSEHIILNACGGRLRSDWLLCTACNSLFGNSFDQVLAAQTNEMANQLMIKRHRGQPQTIVGKTKSDGSEYKLTAEGGIVRKKPKTETRTEGTQVNITINASDETQFRQILDGLHRKYPQINIEEALQAANRSNYYLDEALHFNMQMGGPEAFKSLAKTAINFFIFKGGDCQQIKHLIPYLEGKTILNVVWLHYPENLIYAPVGDEVSHVLKLVADPVQQIAYVYIELFNGHNYIVLLNDRYQGEPINCTYCFDVINVKEKKVDVKLNYSRDELLDLFIHKDGQPFAKITQRLNRVFKIADSIQTQYQLNNVSSG